MTNSLPPNLLGTGELAPETEQALRDEGVVYAYHHYSKWQAEPVLVTLRCTPDENEKAIADFYRRFPKTLEGDAATVGHGEKSHAIP